MAVDRRNTIISIAIVLAVIAAGAVIYFVSRPDDDFGLSLEATPTPSPAAISRTTATPRPTPTPAPTPQDDSNDAKAAGVAATAESGASEWILVGAAAAILAGGVQLRKLITA